MADEKLNTSHEAQKTEEAPAPAVADPALLPCICPCSSMTQCRRSTKAALT